METLKSKCWLPVTGLEVVYVVVLSAAEEKYVTEISRNL